MIVSPLLPNKPRSGLSLLEVLVAVAIFLFSLTAIARLVDQGVDQAIEMDQRTYASLLAQSLMARLTAGDLPLNSQSEATFEDDPDWKYTIDAVADSIPGLFKVTVKVNRETRTGRAEVTLNQLVLDPTKRGGTNATTTTTDDSTSGGTTTP